MKWEIMTREDLIKKRLSGSRCGWILMSSTNAPVFACSFPPYAREPLLSVF